MNRLPAQHHLDPTPNGYDKLNYSLRSESVTPKVAGAGRARSSNGTPGRVAEGRRWSPRAAGTGNFR
eukprot:4994265-Prymnesium_polylepis.1